MPELPEAETIVRGLLDTPLPGRRIVEVDVVHADVLRDGPDSFLACAKGRTIDDVRRRGKNVVLVLACGRRIVINLGMTGSLLPDPPETGPGAPTHPAVVFELDRGRLVYHDVRRFGRLACMDADAYRRWESGLGPEPLDPDFTADELKALMARSRSPVRNWLLDQARIAGVGNIYASEALFRARIDPRRPCAELTREDHVRLHRGLRAVLREALEAEGTSLRDFRTVNGRSGEFQERLRVYAREGLPCERCGTPIRRIVQAGRGTYFCPSCQP